MPLSNRNIVSLFFRLILGFVYLSAGFSKFAPDYIGNVIGPSKLPDDLFPIEVLYLFYTMAFLQILAGTLILSLRYAGAGLFVLLPLTTSIFIFTLVAGFGATPIINVILLGITILEVYKEYVIFSKHGLDQSFISYMLRKNEDQYPKKIVHIIVLLIILNFISLPFQYIHLTILLSAALCLLTVILMQLNGLIILDRLSIIIFMLFSLSVINGIWLKELVPNFFYKVLVLIPIGTIIGLLRLVWYRYIIKKQLS